MGPLAHHNVGKVTLELESKTPPCRKMRDKGGAPFLFVAEGGHGVYAYGFSGGG
jgi:hypothetical protein